MAADPSVPPFAFLQLCPIYAKTSAVSTFEFDAGILLPRTGQQSPGIKLQPTRAHSICTSKPRLKKKATRLHPLTIATGKRHAKSMLPRRDIAATLGLPLQFSRSENVKEHTSIIAQKCTSLTFGSSYDQPFCLASLHQRLASFRLAQITPCSQVVKKSNTPFPAT